MKKYFILIFYTLCYVNSLNTNTFGSLIQDPRKNSSFYDLILKINPSFGTVIGNIRDILQSKNSINKTTQILSYKLIYYSPQFIPSSLFNQASSTQEPIFSVDSKTGSIFIKTPSEPVLEYLCIKKAYCSCFSCIFSLNIIYSTENKINAETIRVFIDDHNDFVPEFYSNQGYFTLNVSESSQIGEQFRLSNAVAFDSDAFYNQITYYISDRDILNNNDQSEIRSNLFEVSQTNPESKDLNLILKSHLDYESQRHFELYLIAKDNGSPHSYKVSKKLIINVLDENDNSPICDKSLYIESIKENKIERDFLQIRASDLDSGYNARLLFSIVSEAKNTSKIENLFEIDKMTGWLSLKQPLDYEKKQFYDLKIQVIDSGLKNSFRTFCMARINVIDLNDNPAKMKVIKYLNESVQRGYYSINTMSDENMSDEDEEQMGLDNNEEFSLRKNTIRNQIEFYENNQNDLVLALIRVFDYDTMSNYRFSIQSATNIHEDTSMFEIRISDKSTREYELIGKGSFDSEQIQNYRLKIILYDLQSFENLENSKSLMLSKPPSSIDNQNSFQINLFERIKVLDLNDNKPEFLKSNYQFKLKENELAKSLTSLNPIEIYDLDTSDKNSKLRFKILDKHNSSCLASQHLYVNDSNNNYPILMISKAFDYEIHGDEIEFDLMAIDIDNLSDICSIIIKLEDLNDNPPLFMNNNATFSIKENLASSSFIGQVIAIDKDSPGANSDISYRILNENLKNLFKIYKTGVLSNLIAFDREVQSFYTLKIEAYDNGKPSLSSIGTYFINIEDENDNIPKILYPNESVKLMNVKLSQYQFMSKWQNLIQVFNVKAEDGDLEENGRLSYFIQDSLGLLKIDKSNGSVYFNLSEWNITSLNELNEFKKIVLVQLRVCDNGKESLSKMLNFTLYFNFDLDELPIEVLKAIQGESKLNEQIEFLKPSMFKLGPDGYKNFFQIVSNSVLLIILLAILLFMICIASFIIVIMYLRIDEKKKNKNNLAKPSIRCFDHVKGFCRDRLSLNRISSSKVQSKVGENLTVKDESNSERVLTITPNNFKITIKSIDPKSSKNPLVLDSFNTTRLNEDFEENQEIQNNNNHIDSINESNATNLSDEYSDELNVYSQEISVNDFYRNSLTSKHLAENNRIIINDEIRIYPRFSQSFNSGLALLESNSNPAKRNMLVCKDEFEQSDPGQNYYKQTFKCKVTPFKDNNNTHVNQTNELDSNSIKHFLGSQASFAANTANMDPLSGLIEKFEKFYNCTTNSAEFSDNNHKNTNSFFNNNNSRLVIKQN